ncbi:hypothetical protein D9615_010160 [Tricholomella constricta]|uniref:Uncharacterized protein n=1 Tax=Tricholomella constricta TaxID=117010 RepID=A0A8H5LUB3_9AGAR|nr:hypothetical protein D9615_010160 [Tricholomella constricta]
MSRRSVAASTTTTLQATPLTTAQESPRVQAFMHSTMKQYGLTEQEVRKRAAELFGSLERAMQVEETVKIEKKAAIERAFPNGTARFEVGRKPKPGEEVVMFAQLRDDLMIRIWPGDLGDRYCFDFVNRERQYILAPDDVKIYSAATAFTPSMPVVSIEQALDEAGASFYSHATRPDPNYETYNVHEGTILRITQKNHPDRYLNMPMRIPDGAATLVLQPW